MNVFQVRRFDGKKWHNSNTFAILEEATSFAKGLLGEWDIKVVSLDSANSQAVA
jgi:hypothetical protein